MIIENDISLMNYNTFGVASSAKYFCAIKNKEELNELHKSPLYDAKLLLILGGGSNLLLTQNFNGLVIKNEIKGIQVLNESDSHVIIEVGSGEVWHEFVLYAINQNWGGIENLSLIPGTVGAAPMQNIGAYGVEIKEVFESLNAYHLEKGEIHTFNKDECEFGYRESIFKNKVKGDYLITSVTLKLTKNHTYNTSYGAIQDTLSNNGIKEFSVKAISDAVIQIRQSKLPDPSIIGNAGSFFKNPIIDSTDYEGLKAEFGEIPNYHLPHNKVKIPAGWLIEQCGWKGKRVGNIGVHDKQALVLVNYGGGTGLELKDLSLKIRSSVATKFGIELLPEVNFV